VQPQPHTLRLASFESSVLTSAELARQPLRVASDLFKDKQEGICSPSAQASLITRDLHNMLHRTSIPIDRHR